MNALRYLLLFVIVTALACATAVEDDDSVGLVGQGANGGSSSTGVGGASSSTGSTGMQCDPPEHLCGGICTGNTPETGCYQSTMCTACPIVEHGAVSCSDTGNCDVECTAPYVKNGGSCTCPVQCCTNDDCASGEQCENDICITPCVELECIAYCLVFHDSTGQCQNNECVCIP